MAAPNQLLILFRCITQEPVSPRHLGVAPTACNSAKGDIMARLWQGFQSCLYNYDVSKAAFIRVIVVAVASFSWSTFSLIISRSRSVVTSRVFAHWLVNRAFCWKKEVKQDIRLFFLFRHSISYCVFRTSFLQQVLQFWPNFKYWHSPCNCARAWAAEYLVSN